MGLKEDAQITLANAYSVALSANEMPKCRHKQFIDYVIDNTHLTFKYRRGKTKPGRSCGGSV